MPRGRSRCLPLLALSIPCSCSNSWRNTGASCCAIRQALQGFPRAPICIVSRSATTTYRATARGRGLSVAIFPVRKIFSCSDRFPGGRQLPRLQPVRTLPTTFPARASPATRSIPMPSPLLPAPPPVRDRRPARFSSWPRIRACAFSSPNCLKTPCQAAMQKARTVTAWSPSDRWRMAGSAGRQTAISGSNPPQVLSAPDLSAILCETVRANCSKKWPRCRSKMSTTCRSWWMTFLP